MAHNKDIISPVLPRPYGLGDTSRRAYTSGEIRSHRRRAAGFILAGLLTVGTAAHELLPAGDRNPVGASTPAATAPEKSDSTMPYVAQEGDTFLGIANAEKKATDSDRDASDIATDYIAAEKAEAQEQAQATGEPLPANDDGSVLQVGEEVEVNARADKDPKVYGVQFEAPQDQVPPITAQTGE